MGPYNNLFGGESVLSLEDGFFDRGPRGIRGFFSCSSRGSRLQFGESWPEIFEDMDTSPNQSVASNGRQPKR